MGELEHVALSHFDLDHRGGLNSLLIRHAVTGNLWIPESALGSKGAEAVLESAERAGVPLRFITNEAAPPGWRCWLSPFRSGNDVSPLCRAATPKGESVLLTGDMSAESEEWFLSALRPFPKAEVLKVAHHGSRSSSSSRFLAASGASLALIGVGKNRYGHPTQEALSRIKASGMKVRRTDREGTLAIYPHYLPVFTEEIVRAPSLVKPGSPAATRRVYAWPASVK